MSGQPASFFLAQAASEMQQREQQYDQEGGERSMVKTTKLFEALTGHDLTPADGWKFMALLKLVRSEYHGYRQDDYVDGAAYFALAGESASLESDV